MHFNEGVQTHNVEGTESFHIVQQSSCGINNDIPLSYLTNSMEDVGNNLDAILIKYYSETMDPNPMYVASTDLHINVNTGSYPKVNQLCHFCWVDISNDTGHMSVSHPKCFCNPERYPTPRDLEIHFKVHNLRNTNCPEKGCDATLDTLYDLSTHHAAHLQVEPRDKIVCSLDNRLPGNNA